MGPVSPVFTAREGKVFHRGVYVPEPSRQLAVFLESAARKDWFGARAAELATELQDAITVAEDFHQSEHRSAA